MYIASGQIITIYQGLTEHNPPQVLRLGGVLILKIFETKNFTKKINHQKNHSKPPTLPISIGFINLKPG